MITMENNMSEKKDCAKVSISRVNDNKDGYIRLSVEDSLSGNKVLELKITHRNFSEILTGLAYVDAEYRFCPSVDSAFNYRKARVVDSGYCDKANGYDNKEEQKEIVYKHFNETFGDEWILHDDGTGSQQPGNKHKYNVKKFV